MTKLRLSNHTLLIEKGRNQKMEEDLRVCSSCPNTIEDEIHFLLDCPTYQDTREKLLLPTLNTKYLASNKDKFCFLLTNKTSIKAVAAYIKNAFTTRENTITQNGNVT